MTAMHSSDTILRTLSSRLSPRYTPAEARIVVQMLLCHITRKSLTQLLAADIPLSDRDIRFVDDAVMRLIAGEPVQYVVGEAEFYGRLFTVDRRVLIPRPETEELVQRIIHDYSATPAPAVIDIGTGSGCIAISLALGLTDATVSAVDISPDAIDIARHNADTLHADVALFRSDVLNWHNSHSLPHEADRLFDIIVSNPPYIRLGEQASMDDTVLLYEPHNALFVPDHDPLLFYRAIALYASSHLSPRGSLYFEINQALGRETSLMLTELGFADVTLIHDINHNPRIISAKRQYEKR